MPLLLLLCFHVRDLRGWGARAGMLLLPFLFSVQVQRGPVGLWAGSSRRGARGPGALCPALRPGGLFPAG